MSKFAYQEILKNLRTFSEREDLDSNQKRILHNNIEKLDTYRNRMEKVDLQDTLTKPFPMELRKTRKGYEGKTLTYIETVYYIERLNQAFSYQWDFQVLQETITDIEVIVKGRLTVEIDGRTVIKEQYGQAEIAYITVYDKQTRQAIGKKPLTGDACKSAGSDCLKKCASLLSVGSELYKGTGNNGNGNKEITTDPGHWNRKVNR